MKVPTFTLSNNVEIPVIGSGPGILGNSTKVFPVYNRYDSLLKRIKKKIRAITYKRKYIDGIIHSFKIGYTLLDFSASYGNEQIIGEAIKKSGIDRKDLFLTTRVSSNQIRKGNIKEEFFNTLKYYRTDYVDLYMFHFPVKGVYLDTWKQMEQIYKEGHCRAIGVANCHQHHLEEILGIADIVPHINQFEIHPLFTQKSLIEYCKSKNIVVEAYTPIARFDERLVNIRALKLIAIKYKKTVVQIILRWHIQNGIIPIVRSWNRNRQMENISIFDFELTDEEIKIIDSFNINSRLRYDPDNCDLVKF